MLKASAPISRSVPPGCCRHYSRVRSCASWPGPSRIRTCVTVAASAGKGFGSKTEKPSGKVKKKSTGREEERAVSKILEKLDAEAGEEGSSASASVLGETLPQKRMQNIIDPKQAARGRVDYVRVEGWQPRGKGAAEDAEIDPEDLGNLPVRSFSQGAGMPQQQPPPLEPTLSNSSDSIRDGEVEQGVPFYEQLVRHLQLLDSQGELAVARPKNAAPLPPFEKWSFGDERFLQYLVDLQSVHSALEDALDLAMSTEGAVNGVNGRGVSEKECWLHLFGPSLGLHRCSYLQQDIEAMKKEVFKGEKHSDAVSVEKPSTQAAAHAAYIASIARGFSKEDGEGGLASLRKSKQTGSRGKAEMRLFANLYALYISNLTTGMRIGAKAMDCAPSMAKAGAVRFFQDYPGTVDDPLKTFIQVVNRLGESLNSDEKDIALEELPKAVVKTSLLLSVLAVEKAAVVAD